MIFPMSQNEIEDWCKNNDVEMTFDERQGETHMMKFVRLSKGDMWVEYEYSPDIRQVVTTQAIHCLENKMRAREKEL